jgi:single-stranded DNA-specific DHH superfamily exonuclease
MTTGTEPCVPSFVDGQMISRLSEASDVRAAAQTAMLDALASFRSAGSVIVLSHFDADGLSAAAILVRALGRAGRAAMPFVIGKTESPWDSAVGDRIAALDPAGLIVADLGTRADPVLFGCPTLVLDHHVPTGEPQNAVTLSGNGLDPEPTTALLAWWAASALGDQSDLLWLAAIGLIGDMADELGFTELDEARARWGKTTLRDAPRW